MGNRQDIDFVVEVLAEIVERRHSGDARLAHGAALRQEIREAIAEGKSVNHYRYVWLVESATQLMSILGIMANEFDQAHPDDMCSAQDLMDILRVAYTRTVKGFEARAEKEDAGS